MLKNTPLPGVFFSLQEFVTRFCGHKNAYTLRGQAASFSILRDLANTQLFCAIVSANYWQLKERGLFSAKYN